MAEKDTSADSRSRHQNVSGHTIFLYKKNIGNSVCIEYTVEKENCPLLLCSKFYVLALCLIVIFLCVFLESIVCLLSFAAVFFTILYSIIWNVKQEVLLVTVPLGLQFTAFYQLGLQTTCFIPWRCIKDIYIVEAISYHRVLYNLVVLTDIENSAGESNHPSHRLIPLFQGMKPRLSCLESIYQSIYGLLPKRGPKRR